MSLYLTLILVFIVVCVVGLFVVFPDWSKQFFSSLTKIKLLGFTLERENIPSKGNNSKKKPVHGVTVVEAGPGRGEAFLAMRTRAKKRIVIMGIGMGGLTQTELDSLRTQAKKVSIDLLMIDPEYLKRYPEFSSELEKFLRKPDLVETAERSYRSLRGLCEDWNKDQNNIFKFRLRLYSTIPTLTMVAIDPEESKAEILFESFLPFSGERSRFLIEKRKELDVFEWFFRDLNALWDNSRSGL